MGIRSSGAWRTGDRRREHARQGGRPQHVPDLEGRNARRLRAEGRDQDELDEQRHPVRSKMLPPNDGQAEGNAGHAWRLGGYQMDLDFNNQYPGQLYEEAAVASSPSAERSPTSHATVPKGQIGSLESADVLKALFKPGEWNQFHLIARGNTLIHIVNGHVTAVCVDDDVKGDRWRASSDSSCMPDRR